MLDRGVGDGVIECDDALSGFDAIRKQDHKQALKHFHSAMLKDEDNPLVLAGIGIALIALGKGGGSIEHALHIPLATYSFYPILS